MADEIKTESECIVLRGENLPNHSETLRGKGKYIRVSGGHSGQPLPTIRTRQEAFRLAAQIVSLADGWLPDEEDQEYDFQEILAAVLEN